MPSLSPEVVREVFDHTRALPCPEAVASCEPDGRIVEEADLAILLCVLGKKRGGVSILSPQVRHLHCLPIETMACASSSSSLSSPACGSARAFTAGLPAPESSRQRHTSFPNYCPPSGSDDGPSAACLGIRSSRVTCTSLLQANLSWMSQVRARRFLRGRCGTTLALIATGISPHAIR
jgi:hypothetical protein